jgi:hypothetical protein
VIARSPRNGVHASAFATEMTAFHAFVEQIQRLSNPLSDPDTKQELERLHGVVADRGATRLRNVRDPVSQWGWLTVPMDLAKETGRLRRL